MQGGLPSLASLAFKHCVFLQLYDTSIYTHNEPLVQTETCAKKPICTSVPPAGMEQPSPFPVIRISQ